MAMFLQAIMLPLHAAFPCLCTVIALCSLLSSSNAKSCKCSGGDEDLSHRYTTNTTISKVDGDLFLLNPRSTLLPGSLGFYKNHSSNLNLSAPGLFVISDEIDLWVLGNNGAVHKTSFSVIFTMSMYQPKKVNGNLGLIFAMIPQVDFYNSIAMHRSNSYWYPTSIPYSAPLAGNQVMVQAGAFSWISANDTIICLKISMEPMSSTVGDTGMVNYRISIDFIPLKNQMSIQVSADAEGQPNPASFKAIMPLNSVDYGSIWPYGIFTFSSSVGQLLKLHFWNLTVERFSKNQAKKGFTIIILSTVLGSAAATAVTAAIVYWYFNSKYRMYKKDLDQLAKSMRLLPGMPTKFIFAAIKKTTRNFHESMRLGQGGFGAVYRCKLPPDKKGEMIEVAVKKFSTNDSRFYEDFLAEVSVINRLRHKNIIPLVRWCYNKGEPLLVYEYMPNGSLDQHLFHISGSPQQHPTHIHRWETRYNIVKDIATGLHYIHHEYEPIVLHRDIKSNNIMIDSTFQARLGDFGLACVVDEGKNSYTDVCAPGTLGFRAPEYVLSGKATTKSEIFAFGVLILEIVTGKMAVNMQCSHVTDWVWHLHQEDTLLGAVDPILTTDGFEANDAKRLLLLGLACSSPNPSERPTMVEALQIITKSAPPPDVPLEKPRFVWPQEEGHSLNSGHSTQLTILDSSLTMEVEMTGGGQASCGNRSSSFH